MAPTEPSGSARSCDMAGMPVADISGAMEVVGGTPTPPAGGEAAKSVVCVPPTPPIAPEMSATGIPAISQDRAEPLGSVGAIESAALEQ